MVIFWSVMAAIWLPAVSCTAPASISSWGVTIPFTVSVLVSFRSNVMEAVPLAVIISFESVIPPVVSLAFRT